MSLQLKHNKCIYIYSIYSINFEGVILVSGNMLAISEAYLCTRRKLASMLIADLSAKSSILYSCH